MIIKNTFSPYKPEESENGMIYEKEYENEKVNQKMN